MGAGDKGEQGMVKAHSQLTPKRTRKPDTYEFCDNKPHSIANMMSMGWKRRDVVNPRSAQLLTRLTIEITAKCNNAFI